MNDVSSSSSDDFVVEVVGIRLASLTGVDIASRACMMRWAELLSTVDDVFVLDVEGQADTDAGLACIRLRAYGDEVTFACKDARRYADAPPYVVRPE